MKILHTSDLHLGHSFHNYDRSREQADCLRQIEGIIAERRPDAYLISGDIYHTASPQTSAQEMLLSHLLKVHEIAPSMKVIVTGGNHDSSRIEIDDPLWNLVGVSVIASVKRSIIGGEDCPDYHRELFARHIIPIGNLGYVIAIPHCYPGNFPSVKDDLPREERQKEFISLMLNEVERRNSAGLPVVIMAHTAVSRSGGENPDAIGQDLDIIGGIDMISEDAFGSGYDYVALGHIHYPQDISPRIRYSGSPLPVSFDEDFQHSVSLVTIGAHGSLPQVEAIPITNAVPIVTIPEQDRRNRSDIRSLSWEEARQAFESMVPDLDCYVRLNVTDDGTIPVEAKEIAVRIPERLGLKARFCLINRIRRNMVPDGAAGTMIKISTAELGRMTPYSVAELFLRETGNTGLDPEVLSLLKETISEVENPEQEAKA